MKPGLVVDALEELTDTGAGFLEITIFVAVDLFIFQRLHERLASGIGGGRQLHRMVTLPIPTSR